MLQPPGSQKLAEFLRNVSATPHHQHKKLRHFCPSKMTQQAEKMSGLRR